MASFLPTIDSAALLLLCFLLPLRILSLSLTPPSSSARGRTRSLLVILLSALALVVSLSAFSDPSGDAGNLSEVERVRGDMEAQSQDLKDQILRLGSILEESTRKLSVKTEILEEDSRTIDAMERDIQYLINEQENIKKSLNSHYTNNLENEMQFLKDESQILKSNIQNMEFSAKDAEKKLETLNSEIKKIENIIAEQWIQIRQFEQAFQLTKIMASKVQKRNNPDKSPVNNTYKQVLQIAEAIYLQYAKDINTIKSLLMEASSSFISHSSYYFNIFNQAAKKRYHTGFRLIRRIRLRYVSDKGVTDSFFMGCSVSSKNCVPHVYKHYRDMKSLAHKYHHKVNDFVNRLIEST